MAANEQQQKEDRECGREPAHHARRPMNAFLIFCKRHRTCVRSHFPNLENRAVTRVLGEWWATLHPDQKQSYINLAQEYKDAFLNANPDFKWYKLPAPPLRTLITRPTNKKQETGSNDDQISELLVKSYEASSCSSSAPAVRKNDSIQPGKLADESQIGGLSSLFTPEKIPQSRNESMGSHIDSIEGNGSKNTNVPKPPKKRYTGLSLIECEQKRECRADLFSDCKIDNESNNNEDHRLNEEISKTERKAYLDDTSESTTFGETNYRGERSCKGLRYQKFIAEQHRTLVPMPQQTKRPKFSGGLGGTEKNMNDRRNSISSNVSEKTDSLSSEGGNSTRSDLEHLVDSAECRVEASKPEDTETEGAEPDNNYLPRNSCKRFRAEDFNLEKKIEALPSLSLEEFQEKKKQQRTKKKNMQQEMHMHPVRRCYTNQSLHEGTEKILLVGSQKRKARKRCITRNASATMLENHSDPEGGRPWCASPDLEALACLAELAANRTKLTNQNSQNSIEMML